MPESSAYLSSAQCQLLGAFKQCFHRERWICRL